MSDFAWKWARGTDSTRRTLVINAVLCTALLGTWSAAAQTTTPGNFVWEEFSDRIAKTEKVTALGPDLFGDNVRLSNGELGFEVTDITLPGNNALEVKLTRTYDVVSRKSYTPDAMLADWQIKVPNISGSYAQDWGTGTDAGSPGRCSTSWLPADPLYFDTREFWNGLSVDIPGGGGELLRTGAGLTQPQDGSAYPWTTSGQVFFACLPTIQNAGGEGFMAITPDGTRYWFDWLAQMVEPTLKKYQYYYDNGSEPQPQPWRFLQRRKNLLLATRVQDRFGNTVQYTYANAWNGAPKLTAITASDGRQLTLTYSGDHVSSISDGTRQWQYQYNNSASRRGLSAVVLPDGSQWSINFGDFTRAVLKYADVMSPQPGEMFRNCIENEVPVPYPAEFISGTMVHPSGATGQFTVTSLEHGRSHVPLNCRGIDYTPGFENRIGTSDPKSVQQYFNAQVGQLPTALDFVPVIGDVKGFVDAAREPTLVNFAAATIGLAGPLGDVAGKGLKNGRKVGDALGLEKMLASESQLADVMAGKGAVIAGSGSDTVLRDSPRLSAVHGGEQADWAKVTSSTRTASDGSKFATHAYQNTKTGLVVEPKTKLEKAPEDIE